MFWCLWRASGRTTRALVSVTLATRERLTGAAPCISVRGHVSLPPILSSLIIRYTKIKTSELNSNIDLKHNKSSEITSPQNNDKETRKASYNTYEAFLFIIRFTSSFFLSAVAYPQILHTYSHTHEQILYSLHPLRKLISSVRQGNHA